MRNVISTGVMVGLLVALAACTSDDSGPYCGDGTCDRGESAAACPEDCSRGSSCGDGFCATGESSAGCPTDCPVNPYCGDGACSNGETTASCAGDCPCTDNTAADDTCTANDVCIGGACTWAFGRTYTIWVLDAQVQAYDATGAAWDAAGGLPDPIVELTLNGASLGTSSVAQDSLAPTWDWSVAATVPAGATLDILVYDSDITTNDYMFGCEWNPLAAGLLRAFMVECDSFAADPAGTGSKVWFYFAAS